MRREARSGHPAQDRRRAPTHIPSLDGLRAVSFAIVFLAHAGVAGVPGGFGVTVFFYLSGFLITTLMRQEVEKTGTVHLRHFYLRRVLRILPPFYLILGFACALSLGGMLPGGLELRPILAQTLHVTNYWLIAHGADGIAAGTAPYWSLAVEEHFYLLFPLLYIGLTRTMSRQTQAATLLALCALVLVWRCILIGVVGVIDDRTYMGSDTRADSLFFGCALAIGLNPMLDAPAGDERLWKWLLFPAALAVLVFTFAYRGEWFRETVRYTLQGIALTPIFVTAIRFPEWGPCRFLNARPVAFVGVLSYSLYLIHQVVLASLGLKLPDIAWLSRSALALLVSFAIAVVIHYSVEKPLARVRKRLARSGASG
jgi:peptidoglycan/LPS O-acetylase OafA/YrhL